MSIKGFKYVVVGAGFWGSTLAERIANDLGQEVLVIEKRGHIGGNVYSCIHPRTGIEYHQYGPHIFHTANERVWKYINEFTSFNSYRHQVLTTHQNKVYQMPINLETINAFYNLNLKPFEVEALLKKEIVKENIRDPKNLEEKAISLIGRSLYEAFIKGYTRKQWQKDPRDLPAFIIERLPVRKNYNESYYNDPWQGIPAEGYTAIFERMLDHKKITVELNTDFFNIRNEISPAARVLYSGPLDQFFDFKFGRLEWRGLDFQQEVMPVLDFQGTAVMNYADEDVPYTRIYEPRHFHVERAYPQDQTLIIKEYPRGGSSEEQPFYPVNVADNMKKFQQYTELKKGFKNIIMGGRLADYAYYDMDQTIRAALDTYENLIKGKRRHGR